ncbi:ATP synthase subunit I [Azospirillum brasilense]|uniref:N-ATPase subunit AtpR n=1 Tax=Azospirillum brasilense TaxID=192 RepID=UPI000E682E58|nr:ATP synthase subunit I [Azospirillum brasilense]NUB30736.1 ATP synthase subunit I [Azospirillum brasilense]RIW05181.1 ATP synthase subunit I [Azospirillum brasilense]
MPSATLIPATVGVLVGAAVGTVFFHALAVAARLTLAGRVRRALPLHALRLGGVVAVFTLTTIHAGVPALLGLLAGFQISRGAAMRRLGKAP